MRRALEAREKRKTCGGPTADNNDEEHVKGIVDVDLGSIFKYQGQYLVVSEHLLHISYSFHLFFFVSVFNLFDSDDSVIFGKRFSFFLLLNIHIKRHKIHSM